MTGHLRWSLLGMAACAGATGPCDDGDPAAPWRCDVSLAMEIGTGEDAFVAFAESGEALLVPGFQGLQHVHVSLRMPVDPLRILIPRAEVAWSLVRLDEGRTVIDEAFGVGLDVVDDTAQAVGLRLVVAEPDEVIGHRVGLGVRMTPVGYGEDGLGWQEMEIVWAR